MKLQPPNTTRTDTRFHDTPRCGSRSLLGHGWIQGVKDSLKHWWLIIRCSGIGCLIGIVPGVGGSVVDWVAYAHTVQSAKDRSQFGKGDIRGVIGPESSNNAKEDRKSTRLNSSH